MFNYFEAPTKKVLDCPYRKRKKKRITKKFAKRYGYRRENILPPGKIMMMGNNVFASPSMISFLQQKEREIMRGTLGHIY